MNTKIIGVDVGTARVGIAVAEPDIRIAHPRTTFPAKEAVAGIVQLLNEEGASVVVIGLPLEMNGSEGPAVRRVKLFKKALVEAIENAGLEVSLEDWDERLTTVAAESILLEADMSRTRRKGVVDKIAAAHILQGWLDSKK